MPCTAAMWRYVMATARGDRQQQQRRNQTPLFTVTQTTTHPQTQTVALQLQEVTTRPPNQQASQQILIS